MSDPALKVTLCLDKIDSPTDMKGLSMNALHQFAPDRLIDHDKPTRQYEEAGLTAHHIFAEALDAMGIHKDAQVVARLAL